MDYVGFLNTLKKNRLELFTLQDVETLYPKNKPKTIKNNLGNWLAKGYITRLKRNLYMITEPGENHAIPDYHIANRLYQPSYVSLETALSFYNIIPEEAAEVTSITTKPTRTIKNTYGVFTYRTCKKTAFTGYRIMRIQGCKILIADEEKAFVDFIHYRLRDGQTDFSGERFNPQLLEKLSRKKAGKYAKEFNKKTLKTVEDAFTRIPA